jgi:hypothetical protein
MNDNDFRKKEREKWLRLADNYLRNSDNEFLERFGAYLEEGYKGSEQAGYAFKEPSWATEQQTLVKEMFDFEAFRLPSMRVKGFALIGKTGFDKLELIKKYFEAAGLSEFSGDETECRYAVVDCSDIKGNNSLIQSLVKNQDVAYVVFNDCDSLLKHDGVLQMFKHLAEDNAGLAFITKNDETVNFKTDSSFVFLGKKNTLHIAVEKQVPKGLDASAYSHFDAFIHFIHVYDFDKVERYYGHDVTPVYG